MAKALVEQLSNKKNTVMIGSRAAAINHCTNDLQLKMFNFN